MGEEPEQVSQELDLRTGVFTQRWRGRTVAVETQRMASMADRQLLCVRLTLTALADTQVRVQSAMDAQVCNLPVHDDQMVEETQTVRLLEPVRQNGRELVMRAVHTGRELRILCDGPEEMNAGLRAGERITVEKRVRVLLDAEAANPDVPDPRRGRPCGGTATSSWMRTSAFRARCATTCFRCCAQTRRMTPLCPSERGD